MKFVVHKGEKHAVWCCSVMSLFLNGFTKQALTKVSTEEVIEVGLDEFNVLVLDIVSKNFPNLGKDWFCSIYYSYRFWIGDSHFIGCNSDQCT